MMYRGVQHLLDRVDDVQRHLRAAILAESTQDMTTHAGAAQTLVDTLLQEVDRVLASGGSDEEPVGNARRVERVMTQAARDSLIDAMNAAETVGMGTNVQELRERLVDFKTHIDFADAYLRAATGLDVG